MPGFDSEFLDLLQLAYNRTVARLSPADETIEEHVCEVVAQAVLSSAKDGTKDLEQLVSFATLAGRRVLQAERFLPTAA
jgi:hypothetical protein